MFGSSSPPQPHPTPRPLYLLLMPLECAKVQFFDWHASAIGLWQLIASHGTKPQQGQHMLCRRHALQDRLPSRAS